jgi:ribosomal protein S18 acetylase RimI-like enzyme
MQPRDSQTQICGEDRAASAPAIEIRPLRTREDRSAFRALNEEWITGYFVMEKKDREILDDPDSTILGKGGHIFMVHAGGETVGCVALIPMGHGVYELSKMAVSPRLRGLGIGRRLLLHAIKEAKAIGAKSLFLGSNAKLENAVHLYESVGFHHVPPDKIPPMPYSRADVFMEMEL